MKKDTDPETQKFLDLHNVKFSINFSMNQLCVSFSKMFQLSQGVKIDYIDNAMGHEPSKTIILLHTGCFDAKGISLSVIIGPRKWRFTFNYLPNDVSVIIS